MSFTLPALPFDPSAFGDWSSAETFSFHHGKHHQAYINKLNTALENNPSMTDKSLEEIIAQTRNNNPGIFNNAAQTWNHTMFWQSITPTKTEPSEKIIELINRDFGSLEKFYEEYTQQSLTLFGSGWVWLIQNSAGKLEIKGYENAETPAGTTDRGLLPLDVWEHSYYIDFRNDRAKYIEGFWQFVNWPEIENRLI